MASRSRRTILSAMGIAGLFLVTALPHRRAGASAADAVGPREGTAMGFALESPAWKSGQEIARQFTCDGEDVSPALEWRGAPAGTQGFSLVVEDPDAPAGTFIHWVLYDLPGSAQSLEENQPKQRELASGARQGRNGFGRIGYGGPCPPPGPAHRYFFRLYALDRKLGLAAGASRSELDAAMTGHVLAQAELMGRYRRR